MKVILKRSPMIAVFLPFLAGLLARPMTAASAQASWVAPDSAAIASLLASRYAGHSIAVVVGLVDSRKRTVIAFGPSGTVDRRPLDAHTVFQVGSVTKVFTGLLLADMAVRGEVSLEQPAATLLPAGVRMPQHGRPITLIDLSKHLSGLPSMPENFSLDARPDPYSAYTERDLYSFLSGYTPPRDPGVQSYSNLGVALLGRLLARRAGVDYEALLRARILDPLGLHSTAITPHDDMRRRLAPGHDRYARPVETWNLMAMPASGSLRSSAADLMTFMEYALGLRHSPLDSAMQLQLVAGRTLGWGRSTVAGDPVYNHEGGKEGYRSAVIINPRTRTGVVVLMNARIDDSPLTLARHLLTGGAVTLPPAPAILKWPEVVHLPAAALDSLAGEYRVANEATLRIVRRDDHLLVDIVGDGIQTCFTTAVGRCVSNTENLALAFERGASGAIAGVWMQSPGDTVLLKRVRR